MIPAIYKNQLRHRQYDKYSFQFLVRLIIAAGSAKL